MDASPFVKVDFQAFPKIARLHRGITITEKIDGTNAAVGVQKLDVIHDASPHPLGTIVTLARPYPEEGAIDSFLVYAQSRTRVIVPGDDNFGFALWVSQHAEDLAAGLGVGLHFGEWWGVGINRAYDIHERRFSLFNTHRWGPGGDVMPGCCSVVPVLATADTFAYPAIEGAILSLEADGSRAAPGFMKPEGVVVYHRMSNTCFKFTLDGDGHKDALKKTRRGKRDSGGS